MKNSFPYRINPLFFLVGMLLVLIGQQNWRPLAAAFNSTTSALLAQQAQAQSTSPALLLLHADALVLLMSNGTTQVVARVRDSKGNPVAGVMVQFQATLGNVTPASVATNVDGVATATFQTSSSVGQAQITASTAGLQHEAAIQVINPALVGTNNSLTIESANTTLTPGQETSFAAILHDSAGQPVAGEVVSLFGSLGEVSPASVVSDGTGRINATFRAGSNGGLATITALAGTATDSMNIQISTPNTPDVDRKSYLPLISR